MSGGLERLAAGCLLPSFAGPERPEWLRPWLERGLGGVVLFASNVHDRGQLRALTAALREDAPRLLVAVDEEGGDVTRLEAAEGSSYPSALGLGYVDDVDLTRAVAGAIAADLASAGVNLNLAPVADVNTNPLNPVIGVRAFGPDPALVSRHVAAFVRGTQEVGVAACAKHFPGHGDTHADSHRELPVAERVETAPFAEAVRAGVQAVMTAHLLVPALDAEPATTSRAIVTGLLREELGFDGVVVSDALDMRAIAGGVGVAGGAVAALAAGVDALCLGPAVPPRGVEAVHAAILEAVRAGRLSPERLSEASARVARLAGWARPQAGDGGPARLGEEAAARALRVEGDCHVGDGAAVLELRPDPLVAAGETGASLGSLLGLPTRALRPGETADGNPAGRLVLVVRDAARDPWQQEVAARLLETHTDAVLVETGLPGWRPPGVPRVETHGAGRASLAAAARALRG